MQFNLTQLSTKKQAAELASKLHGIAGGVRPITKDHATSGLFIPRWDGGPAAFEQAHWHDPLTGEDYYEWHLRFANGAEPNVGMILDMFRRYKNSMEYAMAMLKNELEHAG